ncbi:GNAT family N-acetyltransferase [Ichthyenterobacterium sp. W332]|uniref:GNAT family N-acetyltransferase n=1 Tax=Microcosmobacter mediterraneus TaxID=3075607 RepID=A0ABU2YKQ6_9FLAO|nr:GNAT family N-acetyltransferase [Ichthyenterobacterium sp. W332]MDT0558738.1 GNAT family N-acetyltransferase [Ichthyenterobacterium sp. W332]
MEGDKKGLKYKFQWLYNIIKHGLFWHGVRNNIAKLGIDIMPYYWVREEVTPVIPPKIRGEDKNFKISIFGESEINFVKSTIIGIEQKDLLSDLKRGEICIGLKNGEDVAAYMFIKKAPFYFRKRKFSLNTNEAYLHSMYTFERFRGKNLAPFLRYHSYRLLEEQGVNTFYSVSEFFNKSTIKFKKKMNSDHLKLFMSIVFFKKWTWNFTLKNFK